MKKHPNCRKNINAGQEGQVTLEMLVVAPALLMFVLMLFTAGYDVYVRLNAQAVSYSIGSSIARYQPTSEYASTGAINVGAWGDDTVGDVVSAGIAGAGAHTYHPGVLAFGEFAFPSLEGSMVKVQMTDFRTLFAGWISSGGTANDTYIESVSGWIPGPFVSAKP